MPRTKTDLAQQSKALTHPLRVRIVLALEPGRVASPSELAEELGEPLEQLAYHVARLVEWGCLEFVEDRETPRGAIEHFYRVGERPFYDADTWVELTPLERSVVAQGILTTILADIAGADAGGVLDARLESHITRSPLDLDDHAWVELDALLVTLLEGAHEIAAQAAARVASAESTFDEFSSARLLLVAVPAPLPFPPDGRARRPMPLRIELPRSKGKPAAESNLAPRYKALAHPLRAMILSAVAGRVVSPSELAEELGEPLSSVSYHVRRLVAFGCLELIDKRKVRGAIERFYAIAQYPYYDVDAWRALTPDERADATQAALTAIMADIVGADAAGVLKARLEAHFSRSPLELDDRGWADLDALMVSVLEGAHEIAKRAAERVTSGETPPGELSPARLMMLSIPAPPRPEQKPISE